MMPSSVASLLSVMYRRWAASLCNRSLRSPTAGSPPVRLNHSAMISLYGMPLKQSGTPPPFPIDPSSWRGLGEASFFMGLGEASPCRVLGEASNILLSGPYRIYPRGTANDPRAKSFVFESSTTPSSPASHCFDWSICSVAVRLPNCRGILNTTRSPLPEQLTCTSMISSSSPLSTMT